MYIYFKLLKKGDRFNFSGSEYVKQSTRTAKLSENSRVFYFGTNDLCTKA